jgi:hypothetical protein
VEIEAGEPLFNPSIEGRARPRMTQSGSVSPDIDEFQLKLRLGMRALFPARRAGASVMHRAIVIRQGQRSFKDFSEAFYVVDGEQCLEWSAS